jgi:uncharacterized delta-60 repeat protein
MIITDAVSIVNEIAKFFHLHPCPLARNSPTAALLALLAAPWAVFELGAGSVGLDDSLPLGFSLNQPVQAIQVDPEGRILISGLFTSLNGVSCLKGARLKPDGTPDRSFELGHDLNENQRLNILYGGVRLWAPAGEGRAYVSGPFILIHDGRTYRQVIRVQEDGGFDPQFNIGAAIEGMTVTTALALPDHRLMIARRALDEHGLIRASVALLDEHGILDSGFDSSLKANQIIHALLRQADGKILVAGAFTEIGGMVRDGIARLLANGQLDESFDPGTTPDYDPTLRAGQPIRSLALQSDGRILIAGPFTAIGGQQKAHVARLESDGRLDAEFGVTLLPGFAGGVRVNVVAVQPGDQVVIGGWFERVNDVRSPQAARLLPDGSVDLGFETGQERLDEVFALTIQPDGSLVLGGGNAAGTVYRGQVVRIKASGKLDSAFAMTGVTVAQNFEASAPSVRAMIVQQDGNLILGGRFMSFNRVAATNLVRIAPNGTLDRMYQPLVEGAAVNALKTDATGRILVAGDFPGGLARLLADGTMDPAFNVAEGITFDPRIVWRVRCLAVQQDGRIVVGGWFDRAGGMVRYGLARFHPDGSLDVGFAPRLWRDSGWPVVNAILVQPDGNVIIGGSFNRINDVQRNALARLRSDGELDETFDAAAHVYSVVNALAFDAAGDILVGGENLQLAGANAQALARVNASGSLDSTFLPAFTPLLTTNPRVGSIVIQPDGMILVGGMFGGVDDIICHGLIRLRRDGTADPDFHVGTGLRANPLPSGTRLVWTLVLDPDGRLLVGGDFAWADGTPRGGLARWWVGLPLRNRLWLSRDRSLANALQLRLNAPVLAGTRIEVSSDLVDWLPWQTGLDSATDLEWELEGPLSYRQFFRMVREDPVP